MDGQPTDWLTSAARARHLRTLVCDRYRATALLSWPPAHAKDQRSPGRPARSQRRRDDVTRYAIGRQRALQLESARARLIAAAKRALALEPLNKPPATRRIRGHPVLLPAPCNREVPGPSLYTAFDADQANLDLVKPFDIIDARRGVGNDVA